MVWWQYLLLVNVYLLLFYGFYALLLRSETFFRMNRIYLVGSATLSFVIPVIQTEWVRNLFITQKINQTIYRLDTITITASPQQADTGISVGQILGAIYLVGIIILLMRLAMQLLKLRHAFNDQGTGDAFSFFGKVKINKALSEQEVIAAHEDVHARQWHSADVLLIEFVAIINWFNPVVYLYRKAIKHIHEFIADNEIISRGTAKQEYAMLLLSQTFNAPINQLANSFFNHSLLKQRIMMLHKNPSRRKALLKYGLCAPLFAIMIILSSATVKTNKAIAAINKKAAQVMQFKTIVKTDGGHITTVTTTAKQLPASAVHEESMPPSGLLQEHKMILVIKDTTKNRPIFTSVENSAEPAGGLDGFYKFLGNNIRYPAEARSKNVQGRVICTFVVEQDGSLSNLKVIRGVGSGLDEEAVKVLSMSPKWTPGRQDGQAVRQQYTVPISFTLQGMPANPGQPKITNVKLSPPPPPSANNGSKVIVGQACINCGPLKIDTTGKEYHMNFTGPNSPDYYVDDVKIKYADIKDVNPSDIESISVIKAKPGSAFDKDQVRIVLKKKK